jgi:GxxExxY protein
MEIEYVATQIVDAAFKVHSSLGPGLLESAYQTCLSFELNNRGISVECEVPISIQYEGQNIATAYRVDMVIEKLIAIENKTVERCLPIHDAQLLTYLRLGGYKLGFLINWNVIYFKNGIKRFALNLPEPQWQRERK